jgi:hypothetical protein
MTETTETFEMILTDQWDDEIAQVVGQITIAFAQLEHVLWVLPKRIEKMAIRDWDALAGKEDINGRCKQVRMYFAKNKLPELAALDRLLNEVKRLNDERNSVVHGRWGCKKLYSGGPITSRHRFWRDRDKGVDLRELEDLRDRIRSLRDQLQRFVPGQRQAA